MATPEPFREYRRVQSQFDAQLAATLERTAKAIRTRMSKLGTGFAADIRRSQLTLVLDEIQKVQHAMWTVDVLPLVQRGRRAGANAAQDAVETITRPLYAALPEQVAEALTDGLRATAASGIASDMARIPRQLSARVYRMSALHSGVVHDLIRQGLISGLSARELSQTVYRYISPTTPGGASYAAQRLARTEINNAFHERQIEGGNRPGVKAIRWNLSGSHRVPDQCNLYAQRNSHKQGPGVFPVGKVPDRPHPQCFCYMTYVTMTSAEFKRSLSNGDFDDELDRRTKANLRRLGFNA